VKKTVSVVIPAYNEADSIVSTLQAVREHVICDELIVVDDGSTDGTGALADSWADLVIRLPRNQGKGAALQTGWRRAAGDIVLLLDGDLRESAGEANRLIAPVLSGVCDMAVAVLPAPARKAGVGLAKGLARHGIRLLTGYRAQAPLSGQRAIRRQVLERTGRLDKGFGIEVGLTIDALRAGYRVLEVPVAFSHRETGNDWAGYCHRGKEFWAIGRALGRKWWEGSVWTRN
jgi:glycosyltransferase involved in cell wall biosynthesis